jgi:WD40 repeat protein
VWDAETGKAVGAPLQGHTDWVLSVAISLDGCRIVSGSSDNTIYVWDAETGKPLGAPLQGHTGRVWSVAISPDGTRIVSGSEDKTIRVWDAETGKPLGAPLQGHLDRVLSVAISPDGTYIVSGSQDRTIRLWDAETGKPLGAPLQGHSDQVWAVAISPDGTRIVSGSSDWVIRVWDAGKALGAALPGHPGTVQSAIVSGSHVVAGSSNQTDLLQVVESFNQFQAKFHGHAICFSSNPIHALRSASSFVLGSSTSLPTSKSSFVPTKERWIVLGLHEDLLLWIPIYLPSNLCNPHTTHVIPIGSGLQLDLSCLAHGISWQMCYERYIHSMSYSPAYLNNYI